MTSHLQAALQTIAIMFSGTAAGAEKPLITMALEVIGGDWLRAGVFHDVQWYTHCASAHQQDEYTAAAFFRDANCDHAMLPAAVLDGDAR